MAIDFLSPLPLPHRGGWQAYLDHVRGPPLTDSAAAVRARQHKAPSPSPTPATVFAPGPGSGPGPAGGSRYASSQCHRCFVEYARHEEYVEAQHGADPEVDGIEVSVYRG